MVKKKTPQKELDLEDLPELELDHLPELKLDELPEIELEHFDLTLEPFLLVSDKDLQKIVEDIQELGDITGRDPVEVVKLLRSKWSEEGGK